MRNVRWVLAAAWIVSGCSEPIAGADGSVTADAAPSADGGPPEADAGALPDTLGPSERPAQLVVPSARDGVTPLPVVVLLHGYGANGAGQDLYFGLSRAARSEGFYVIVPDGTVDAGGRRFWNATPACCDFAGTGVDDVAYLTSLLDELEALTPISQIYFVGHSNGGFMSYRMACELADRVSAIVSLAGADFASDTDCVPDRAVSVLQIHGDLDATIPYAGVAGAYPSASDGVARWAERASCDLGASEAGEMLDLESALGGAETETLRYAADCEGAEAELWTIRNGSHIPALNRTFAPTVLAWLRDHAR